MLNRRLPRPSRAVLVGVCALLLTNAALSLALWDVWQTLLSRTELSLSPVQIPEMPSNGPSVSNEASLGDIVLARPVFEASRKPFVPPPPPAPSAPPPVVAEVTPQPRPDLVLGGILLNGGVRKALLRKRNEADGNWQAEGDILDGWTITTVSDAKVVLNKQTDRIEIELYPEEQKP